MGIHVTITLFGFIFFLLQIIQTFHFLVASTVVQSHIESRLKNTSGFISIDCGLPAGSSYQETNGLHYSPEEKYISTGKNHAISSEFHKPYTQAIFSTIRSFPEGLRNCYTLAPLKPNNTYLVRASFMYGNYDGRNFIPIFDVYIGVNRWFTLAPATVGSYYHYEIIHVATTESIDVCLVNTGKGTPFISVLELRPLDSSSYPVSLALSLRTVDHEDVGRITSQSEGQKWWGMTMDDAYDRIWHSTSEWLDWKVITTNNSFDVSQHNPLKVPTSVLTTAVVPNDSLANVSRNYSLDFPTYPICVYWHFAELEVLGSNQTREFNISIPGYAKIGPIKPKYLQVTTIASPRISFDGTGNLFFTLEKTKESTHYPILNGMEVYGVLELHASPTKKEDADAISIIKQKYTTGRIWQGDPCLPKNYQWDALNCTYDGNNPPTITSLSLSSSNLTGYLPPSLIKLTSLKYLNLSNNKFTGKIPEFLGNMPLLQVIDLSENELSGPVPRKLAEKASNKSIVLRLKGNSDVCKSFPCEEVHKKRRHFIIPLLAIVLLLVIIVIIFLALKRTKKKGTIERLVDLTIKSRNKQFNSLEVVRITDNFREVLGKGCFGTVYYGVLQDGTQLAVKVLNNASSPITLKQFCAEVELLTRIHHVNLVSLIGYCNEHANMALVYEFMSCGNLQMHLSGLGKFISLM